jgi:hypothetical protein
MSALMPAILSARVRRGSLCIAASVVLAGCVSTKTVELPAERIAKWQGKTVALTDRPRAGFVAATAGKAAFALIGVAAMVEAGKTIVTENAIEDPAPHLAHDLLAAVTQQYGLVAATMPPVRIDTTDTAQLAHAAHGADILLDVQVVGMGFRYLPTQWGHYVVDSSYKLRIVDVANASLVAEGFCHQKLPEAEAKTHDELLADKAAVLKSTLDRQREHCQDQFQRSVLAIHL